mmetsp:Transcript_14311/g.40712  ORF Transcript_14311/g.40712 Transcript_14311/m.40712 type:complete len:234 (+) Transcript_14311:751-1452(+)
MYPRLQVTIRQRFVLVEQRHDEDGDDRHHEDRKDEHECPHVQEEVIAAVLDDAEQQGDERSTDHECQQKRLDLIGKEESVRLLVESVLLFDLERRVQFEWQGCDGADQRHEQQKDQRDFDFILGCLPTEPLVANACGCIPHEWQESGHEEHDRFEDIVRRCDHPKVDLVQAVDLRIFEFVLQFGQQLGVVLILIFILFGIAGFCSSGGIDLGHGGFEFLRKLRFLVRHLLTMI